VVASRRTPPTDQAAELNCVKPTRMSPIEFTEMLPLS
jgi:hypothetical protein